VMCNKLLFYHLYDIVITQQTIPRVTALYIIVQILHFSWRNTDPL